MLKKTRGSSYAGLLIIAIIVSSCATHKVDLLETGDVVIELVPCRGICAAQVHAYQEGDELVVTGRVKRSHLSGVSGIGYVRILVAGPDGSTLKEVDTQYSPKIVRRKGLRESTFTARISIMPPKGSVIRVSYEGL